MNFKPAEELTVTVKVRDLELWHEGLQQLENQMYYAYNKRRNRKKRIKFIYESTVDLMQRVKGARYGENQSRSTGIH